MKVLEKCGFIGKNGAPGEIRTPDLLVRSQKKNPISSALASI
jgi:hypothetical protein